MDYHQKLRYCEDSISDNKYAMMRRLAATLTVDDVLLGTKSLSTSIDTIRYDRRCGFNVRSKADMSQLNLPHGNDN